MLIHSSKIAGYTLTELMIALVLNVVVLTVLISIFVTNLNHYTTVIATNHLSQQLQSAMNIMVSDIRRAGYWKAAGTNGEAQYDENANPFQAGIYDVAVGNVLSTCPPATVATSYTCGTCITLSYDHANSGPTTVPSASTTSDDDQYGYMLGSTTAPNGTTIGVLQTRPWGGTFSCTATDWVNLTDANVNITALSFMLSTTFVSIGLSSTSGLNMRAVDIVLTGQLTNYPAVTKTLNMHVRIRNDEFEPYAFQNP